MKAAFFAIVVLLSLRGVLAQEAIPNPYPDELLGYRFYETAKWNS
jgi:hypothetical protein